MNLIKYIDKHIEWSKKTFGPGSRTKALTAHIQLELVEIEWAPYDIKEWIDVIILAIDGAWRAGHSAEQIAEWLEAKQEKNLLRTFPKPASEDTPCEHIRGIHD